MMKWKKWGVVAMVAAAFSLVLVGCGSDSSNTSTSNNKKIVIGLDDNFPPMGFRDKDNNLVGFDIDLAKATAEKLGREVEFKPIDWASKEAELASGRIDAIWNGLSITPEREKQLTFSEPYMNDRQIIVVTMNSPIQTKNDLKGKVIGIQDGSTSLVAFEKDQEIASSVKDVKKYADNVAALMDAKEGRVDAVVVDSVVGRDYLKTRPGVYRVLDEDFGGEAFAVGMKKGNDVLAADINKALDELRKDGTMKQISEKWFGEDITTKKQ